MSSTVTDLTAKLLSRVGLKSSDPKFDAAHCQDLLQEAADTFVQERVWKWRAATETYTTDSDDLDGSLDLPATFDIDRSVTRLSGTYESVWVDVADIDLYDKGYYTDRYMHSVDEASSELLVRPKPAVGETIVLRYWARETTAASGASTFLCPARFEQAIIEYAAHLAHVEVGNLGEADKARDRYDRHVRRFTKANRTSDGPALPRVRDW